MKGIAEMRMPVVGALALLTIVSLSATAQTAASGTNKTEDSRRQAQLKQIEAARELRANMLIILAAGMSKDGIPASQTPILLPKAAEFMKKKTGSAGLFTKDDIAQEQITNTLYQMHDKALSWAHEFEPEGLRDGEPAAWGLARRQIDGLRYDAALVKEIPGNLRLAKERVITFPADYEVDLRTFKHGTFRVTHDEKDDAYYSQFSVGDKAMIMLVNRGSRRKFAEAQIDSIRQTTIEELKLDELKTEVEPFSSWSIFGGKTLREEITEELIKGLKDFYGPDIDRKTEGYMIIFHLISKPQ